MVEFKNILNREVLPPSYKSYCNEQDDGYSDVLIGIKSNIVSDLVDISPHLKVCTVLANTVIQFLMLKSNLILFKLWMMLQQKHYTTK